jgi:GNAT superfamily N-acetyltransferase
MHLTHSHDFARFALVIGEVDLGESFVQSLRHWCARSERPSDLRLWEVFLALDVTTPVGVCGWYQTRAMPPHLAWLSWLGVRHSLRRCGAGGAMLTALVQLARTTPGLTELWVYTDAVDPSIHRFYERAGFRCAGTGGNVAPHAGLAAEDKVFCLQLAPLG